MPIQKTKQKTIGKESFVKIFRFCGDFAKIRSKEAKKSAQVKRCEFFKKDNKKYLEAMK